MRRATTTDRGVSPVIGVVLMVAITVILAAVIGAFVLDLGERSGDASPQASLSVSTNVGTDTVSIEHGGGEGLDASEIRVIIEVTSSGMTTFDEVGSSVILSVGQTADITLFDSGSDDRVDWDGDGNTEGGTYETDGGAETFDKGDQVTVTLVHVDSQRRFFQTTVTA